jgi:hypothetical protein
MGVIVMKGLKTLLKLAVIASSLFLGAGSIAYRAGAFNGWLEIGSFPEANPSDDATPASSQIFSGSKAGIFIDTPQGTTPDHPSQPDKPENQVIMEGSKAPFRYLGSPLSPRSSPVDLSGFRYDPQLALPDPPASAPK